MEWKRKRARQWLQDQKPFLWKDLTATKKAKPPKNTEWERKEETQNYSSQEGNKGLKTSIEVCANKCERVDEMGKLPVWHVRLELH